jgi:hypothetical protein
MVFPLRFACYISYVILTNMIQIVLVTSECFLSKYTNNMHILSSGDELQAVEFGHAFHPDMKILPRHQEVKSRNKLHGLTLSAIIFLFLSDYRIYVHPTYNYL